MLFLISIKQINEKTAIIKSYLALSESEKAEYENNENQKVKSINSNIKFNINN